MLERIFNKISEISETQGVRAFDVRKQETVSVELAFGQ